MRKIDELKMNLRTDALVFYHKTKKWCFENKEVIIALAPTMIAGSIELIKIAAKKGYVAEEKRLKDMYVYDRANGHYYELCRKPTNKEWLTFEEMRFRSFDGHTGQILKQMGLIK